MVLGREKTAQFSAQAPSDLELQRAQQSLRLLKQKMSSTTSVNSLRGLDEAPIQANHRNTYNPDVPKALSLNKGNSLNTTPAMGVQNGQSNYRRVQTFNAGQETTTNYNTKSNNDGFAQSSKESIPPRNAFQKNSGPSSRQQPISNENSGGVNKLNQQQNNQKSTKDSISSSNNANGRRNYDKYIDEPDYDYLNNGKQNYNEPAEPLPKKKPTNQPVSRQNPTNDTKSRLADPYDIPIATVINKGNKLDIPEYEEDDDESLIECGEGCGRSFKPKVLEKHENVCRKVFQSKRKAFDVASIRQKEYIEQEPNLKAKIGKKGASSKTDAKKKDDAKVAKWKLESAQLRTRLRVARNEDVTDSKEAKLLQTFEKQDTVTCPNCKRNFNTEAGNRHVPFCAERAKAGKLKTNSNPPPSKNNGGPNMKKTAPVGRK